MTKDELKGQLDEVWQELDAAMSDESISAFPKVNKKIIDKLGSIIQELEDDIEADKDKEENV